MRLLKSFGVAFLFILTFTGSVQAADAETQAIYDRSCKACHSTAASGAPQTGDAEAWAPRVAQGIDTLLDHTIEGFKGMPPMGMCMDCDEDQFVALIELMTGSSFE